MQTDSKPLAQRSAAPIGVFDSGVGGLSVLRAIHLELPSETLLYVSDNGHGPYGEHGDAAIVERALLLSRSLQAAGVKALVLACNTATAVAVDRLRAAVRLPIVGIEPAVKPAATHSASGVIGVLATSATLASARYASLVARHASTHNVIGRACPEWVDLVEQGKLSGPLTERAIRREVLPLLDAGADTLVLGCTHFPFLRPVIAAVAGPAVRLIDPAHAVARQLHHRLVAECLLDPGQHGEVRFLTTGVRAQLDALLTHLWPGAPAAGSLGDPAPS